MYYFTEDCIIGIPQIDEEHQKLFEMINYITELKTNTDEEVLLAKNLLNSLRKYAETHFANEEAYMEKIKDPELPHQKKQHEAFAAKVNSYDLDALTVGNAKQVIKELAAYLVRWLYNHILSSDMMIGKLPPVGQIQKEQDDLFAFKEEYHTGIEFVDEEHKVLFSIIEEAWKLVKEEYLFDKFDEIMKIIDKLREYTEIHFSDEEKYMEQIHYPQLEAQKQAHDMFIERIVEIDPQTMEELDDNQQEYLTELIDFLIGWLTNHILKMDKKIGEFVK